MSELFNIRVRITKVCALEGATWKYLKDGEFREGIEFGEPTLGRSYLVLYGKSKSFSTSTVMALLPNNQIQTRNSIYQIEYLKK